MKRATHVNADRPDREASLRQYRHRAPLYDFELMAFEPVRQQAVERLQPERGETVVDVGAGTGLSLPLLAPAVGPRGRVIEVEPSPEMRVRAEDRAAQAGWKQVEFVAAPAETACWTGRADAALFVFTHDVLVSEAALRNVLAGLRPGARVVATGLQWAPAWAVPVNAFVWGAALYSTTTTAALDRPWQHLQPLLEHFELDLAFGGAIYFASGTVGARL